VALVVGVVVAAAGVAVVSLACVLRVSVVTFLACDCFESPLRIVEKGC
jgi:hypothetical protein